jgi:hypothetical protein
MTIAVGNVTTIAAAVYTSSGNSAITFLSLCNYSAGNITANVHVVPSSNTATNNNIVISSIEIAPDDTYQLYVGGEKLILSNGDTVQVNASADNALTAVTSFTSI